MCSPIADNTILTAASAGIDITQHIKTTFPYTLVVVFVALLFGRLPIALGLPYWAALIICTAVLVAFVFFLGGKKHHKSIVAKLISNLHCFRKDYVALKGDSDPDELLP